AATAVVVRDTLPPTLQFVTASDGGAPSTGAIQWSLGALATGTTRTLTLRARLASPLATGTVVTNRATVATAETALFTMTDVSFTTSRVPEPSLSATLAVQDVTGEANATRPGDILTYTLTITNTGDAAAHALLATLAIPNGLV